MSSLAASRFRIVMIDGVQMDMNRVDESTDAFHVHQTQFQILEINGDPPPADEAGWEDSVLVTDNREVVIAARFNTYSNPDIPYMHHCQILDHEDTGMMGQFQGIDE